MQARFTSSPTPTKTPPFAESVVKKISASPMQMASGLIRSGAQAVMHGTVEAEIREERYATCRGCEHFIPDSKRCAECGCFMEAKTWIGGDPKMLCPLAKWSR